MGADSTQYTEQWWQSRRGKVSGSRCQTVMYGGIEAKKRMAESLIEEATQDMPAHMGSGGSAATRWGHDHEDEAIGIFALQEMAKIERPSFTPMPGYEDIAGTSMDFMDVSKGRIVGEVKCPYKLERFWQRVNQPFSRAEFCQVHWHMACVPESDHAIYLCYHPHVSNPEERLYIRRVQRDETIQNLIKKRLDEFRLIMAGEFQQTEENFF